VHPHSAVKVLVISLIMSVKCRAVPDFGSGSGRNPAIFHIRQKSVSGKNPTGAG